MHEVLHMLPDDRVLLQHRARCSPSQPGAVSAPTCCLEASLFSLLVFWARSKLKLLAPLTSFWAQMAGLFLQQVLAPS